jgi:hypothetical protein
VLVRRLCDPAPTLSALEQLFDLGSATSRCPFPVALCWADCARNSGAQQLLRVRTPAGAAAGAGVGVGAEDSAAGAGDARFGKTPKAAGETAAAVVAALEDEYAVAERECAAEFLRMALAAEPESEAAAASGGVAVGGRVLPFSPLPAGAAATTDSRDFTATAPSPSGWSTGFCRDFKTALAAFARCVIRHAGYDASIASFTHCPSHVAVVWAATPAAVAAWRARRISVDDYF